MFRKIVLAFLLALQFGVVTSIATANRLSPIPRCGACPK